MNGIDKKSTFSTHITTQQPNNQSTSTSKGKSTSIDHGSV